jgi:hypothetical protein
MYAVVGIWTEAESQREEQDRGLRAQVIPIVRAHPWLRRRLLDARSRDRHGLHDDRAGRRGVGESFKALLAGRAQEAALVGVTNDVRARGSEGGEPRLGNCSRPGRDTRRLSPGTVPPQRVGNLLARSIPFREVA